VPDRSIALGELASQVRAKNAGPFWITLDVFFGSESDYRSSPGPPSCQPRRPAACTGSTRPR
jgi:hypothetical protein